MDYGLSSALKGFFGSADAKTARNQELSMLQNMYEQDQQEKNEAASLQQQMLKFNEGIDTYAGNIIQGKGIRDSDKQAYSLLNQDAQAILKEQISKSGGILKFMQGGGAQMLQDYKNAITQSDVAVRLANNHEAFKKGLLATQNLDANGANVQTAHLVPQMFLDNLNLYQEGKVDNIVWNGLLNDYDMEDIDPSAIGADVAIDANYVFEHNPMNKQMAEENLQKDFGITRESFHQYAVTEEDHARADERFESKLREYFNMKHGEQYGTGEVEVHLAGEFSKLLIATDKGMVKNKEGKSIYVANPSDANYKENFKNEGGIMMEELFGYSHTWNTETKNGRNVRNVGAVMTNYDEEILSYEFGDSYNDGVLEGGTQKSGDGTWYVGGSGQKIGAGQSHGGETIWTTESEYIGDDDDMTFQGMTIATKVTGMVDGEYVEQLITDDPDDPTNYQEDFAKFDGLEVSQVYVAEFQDTDAVFDDIYYKEINVRSLMPRLEKETDIDEQLSTQRTTEVKYNRERNRNEKQKALVIKSFENETMKKLIGSPFDESGQSNYNKVYNHYIPTLDASLTTMFGSDRSKNLDAHLFTFMIDQSMKTHPDTYFARLDEQVETLTSMQNTDFMRVIKGGSIGNFYQWLDNNGFDSKSIKKKSKTIKRALFDNDFYLESDGSVNYKRRK